MAWKMSVEMVSEFKKSHCFTTKWQKAARKKLSVRTIRTAGLQHVAWLPLRSQFLFWHSQILGPLAQSQSFMGRFGINSTMSSNATAIFWTQQCNILTCHLALTSAFGVLKAFTLEQPEKFFQASRRYLRTAVLSSVCALVFFAFKILKSQ